MKEINIKIKTENAAFQEDIYDELGRMIENIGCNMRKHGTVKEKIYDINGNSVGKITVKE